MALVELRGPVQRDRAPHRRGGPAQRRGAAEIGVGGLQRLHPLGVRPDHEVGIGAQSRDVVEPADHDAVVLLLLEERRGLVDDRGARSSPSAPGRTANTENIR